MSKDEELHTVGIRMPFRIAGMLFCAAGLFAGLGALLQTEKMVAEMGLAFLLVTLVAAVPAAISVGACSILGRLPYWLTRQLPEQMLHVVKDIRNLKHVKEPPGRDGAPNE